MNDDEIDDEPWTRFDQYRRQCQARGIDPPTWREYLASGMPLYDD